MRTVQQEDEALPGPRHTDSPQGWTISSASARDKDNVRIDVYLSERLSLPRSQVKRLIEEGHVRVEERVPKSSFKVRKDIEIEGEVPREEPTLL